MKILLLTEYFPPEIGAGSNRAFELCKLWAEKGINVTVITGFPDYPDGIIPKQYKGHFFLREEMNGINLIRTFTLPAPNKGFFKRVLSFTSFMFSSVIQGSLTCGKPDIVIATSPPFFVGIAGYLISKIKRIPFVFEVRDLWPESIIQLGQLKNKLIIKILEMIELFLYKKAVKIIPVADSSVELIERKGISKDKLSVIKNGFNFNALNEINLDKDFRKKLGYNDEIIVSYIGTLGLSHSLNTVIESARELSSIKNIIFFIIGDGAERENLIRLKEHYMLENIVFIKKVPREDVANYYWLADIFLVTLKDLPLFKKVIPSKIFEIMAFSKPIILNVDGEARKIVQSAEAGIFSEPGNPKDLASKIKLLSEDKWLRKKLGENGRKFVEKNYNRRVLANRYLEILSNIVIETSKPKIV